MADLMRCRDSRTAASGRPTIRKMPPGESLGTGLMSTSASIGLASTPINDAVLTVKCTVLDLRSTKKGRSRASAILTPEFVCDP